MLADDPGERGPLRGLIVALNGGLRPGEVGLVHAQGGMGKTGLLVQLALERLLRSEPVLHVAVGARISDVRDNYDSILEAQLRRRKPLERAEALLLVERSRLIFIEPAPFAGAARLDAILTLVGQAFGFVPQLVVLDGYSPDEAAAEALVQLAKARSLPLWLACTPQHLPPESLAVELEMVPDDAFVRLHLHKVREQRGLPSIRLEAAPFFHRERVEKLPDGARAAGGCTLFSGGAAGAESAFGQLSERWGVREVNYTFPGHTQVRARGATPLTESELAAGDVSLAYVARRLRRSYGEATTIRKVLQSLWHQVSKAEQVFVVGAIQEDGTVVGGTGWAVELARMWGKRLYVFDQEKEGWFRWDGEEWVPDAPRILAASFCGTGSRTLNAAAQQALEELFVRSFGPLAAEPAESR